MLRIRGEKLSGCGCSGATGDEPVVRTPWKTLVLAR